MSTRPVCIYLVLMSLALTMVPSCHAQTPVASPPATSTALPPSMMVTIYKLDADHLPKPVSVDQLKDRGDKFEARNPPESAALFDLLLQNQRAQITSPPIVDAYYEIERSDNHTTYAVSKDGEVWTGNTSYKLSKDDFKTFKALVEKIDQSADVVDGISAWVSGKDGVPQHRDRTIIVVFLVDAHGKAGDIRVVKSCGDSREDDAACDAVREQHFKPVLHDGVPQAAYYSHMFVVGDQQ